MNKELKYSKEFETREINVEKGLHDNFSFYLPKNGKNYKLQFHKNEEKKLIESGLLDYELIDGYEAIYSVSKETIECQLSLISHDYEYLCENLELFDPRYSEEGDLTNAPQIPIEIENGFNVKITIGYSSDSFKNYFCCKGLSFYKDIFTLKISDIQLKDHIDALNKLTEIGLSVLFSISRDLQFSIVLINDQPSRDRFSFIKLKEDAALLSDAKLSIIAKHYHIKPLGYLLNANVCNELPFYQFLQYYHCIEYFFTIYAGSRFKKDIVNKISTHQLSNNDYSNIENALESLFKKSKGFTNELECLKDVFFDCLDAGDINSYIKTRRDLKSYYLTSNNYNLISSEEIKESQSVSLDKLARRIYDIRNSIAHAKSDEKTIELNELNINLLKKDIKLIKYLAEQILIKNSL